MIGTSKIGQTQQLHISDPICLFISFISYALEYDHLYLKKLWKLFKVADLLLRNWQREICRCQAGCQQTGVHTRSYRFTDSYTKML